MFWPPSISRLPRFAAAILLAASALSAHAAPIRPVMLSGQPIPGEPGRVFTGPYPFPTINDAGQVAFKARDNRNDHSVFVERGGSIVRVGTPSLSFTNQDPVIDSSGRILYLNGPKLWHETTGTAQSIDVFTGPPAPRLLLLSEQGQAAFVNASQEILRIVGNQAQLAYGNGRAAPGADPGQTFTSYFFPVINPPGQFGFTASLQGEGITNANRWGVWSEGSGSLQLVARGGDPAPGAGPLRFSLPSAVSMNQHGEIAFGFSLVDANSANVGSGVWTGTVGDIRPVVLPGDPAPGMPAGSVFSIAGNPTLNQDGQLSFSATMSGPAVTPDNDVAIWSTSDTGLRLVAREGDQPPGLPAGVAFAEFKNLYQNGLGQVAFYARLSGPDLNTNNRHGLWAQDVAGNLQLIVREHGTLEIAPGVSREVELLWDPIAESNRRTTGSQDGESTILNDRGEIVFSAGLRNRDTNELSSGVFVSSAVAIPEPSTLFLATVALVFGVLALSHRVRRV